MGSIRTVSTVLPAMGDTEKKAAMSHRDIEKAKYKKTPGVPGSQDSMVARTRFELVISALRGRRPKPLDERAIAWKLVPPCRYAYYGKDAHLRKRQFQET